MCEQLQSRTAASALVGLLLLGPALASAPARAQDDEPSPLRIVPLSGDIAADAVASGASGEHGAPQAQGQAGQSEQGADPAEALQPPAITLEEALRKAKSDPPTVLTARAAVQQAEAERGLAKARWLPSLVGQASYGYAYDNRLVLPELPRINSESLEARGRLNLEWTAIDAARGARIDAAEASEHAASRGLESAQREAMLAVAELFFFASAASELVDDAALSLERRTQQHRATVELVEAGTRSPVDAQRAQIEVVSARYMLQERKSEERAAQSALAVAMGRAPGERVRPAPSSEPQTTPELRRAEQVAQLAKSRRPELQLAAAQRQAAQHSYDAAVNERLPTLGAIASGSISYLDVRRGQGIDGHQFDGAVSVVLRFQGLDPLVWQKARTAEAALLRAERANHQMAHQIGAEAVSALHDLERARIELQRAVAVLEAAQVAREAQNGRYLAGLSSLLELLDAEELEQQARLRRIEAHRDEAVAVIRLLAACGLLAPGARS